VCVCVCLCVCWHVCVLTAGASSDSSGTDEGKLQEAFLANTSCSLLLNDTPIWYIRSKITNQITKTCACARQCMHLCVCLKVSVSVRACVRVRVRVCVCVCVCVAGFISEDSPVLTKLKNRTWHTCVWWISFSPRKGRPSPPPSSWG